MTKVWIRNVRRIRKRISATPRDLSHSSAPPPGSRWDSSPWPATFRVLGPEVVFFDGLCLGISARFRYRAPAPRAA